MNTYKYTDETETLVHIVDENGNSLKSMSPDKVPDGVVVQPAFTSDELVQRAVDLETKNDVIQLKNALKESILIQVELIEWLLANTAMTANNFSPKIKQAYLDLKIIAEKVKAKL